MGWHHTGYLGVARENRVLVWCAACRCAAAAHGTTVAAVGAGRAAGPADSRDGRGVDHGPHLLDPAAAGVAAADASKCIRLLPVELIMICPAVAVPVNVGLAFGA